MTQLKALDGLASETLAVRASGLGPARMRREEDRLVAKIADILGPVVRKITRRKGMLEIKEEVDQHAYIAIHTALQDWDGNVSSFSTYVHWKLRAELKTLELQTYPERRKVCEKIDVRMVYLNQSCNDQGSGEISNEIGDVINLDPEGYKVIEEGVDHGFFVRNIDMALARIAAPRIRSYINYGCGDRTAILTIMRDLHIFVQRELYEQSSREVAPCHNITRERIRQIHDQVKNAFRKNIHDMMQNPCTMAPEDEMNWQLALKIYEEERGYNIQLIERENIGTAEEIEELILSRGDEMNPSISTVAAAAALIASPVAAQDHSRAIPPQSETEILEIVDDPTPSIARGVIPGNENDAVEGIASDLEANGQVEWGVKLGEHPTRYALKGAANSAIQRNPELQRYRPAAIPSRRGEGLGLVFGSLSLPAATSLCSLLQARGEACERIRVGER